jgi:hypothetical protein
LRGALVWLEIEPIQACLQSIVASFSSIPTWKKNLSPLDEAFSAVKILSTITACVISLLSTRGAMEKNTLLSIVVVVMHLAVGVIAHAQQPKKVPRIGYLASADPPLRACTDKVPTLFVCITSARYSVVHEQCSKESTLGRKRITTENSYRKTRLFGQIFVGLEVSDAKLKML